MKKLMLILVLLSFLTVSKSETRYFKAVAFNSKVTGKHWKGWQDSNIYVSWNNITRHVEIQSVTPQIINYSELTRKDKFGYTLYTGDGTDAFLKTIGITFQIFNYGTFYLTIEYSDIQYSYSLIELDTN